MATLPMSRPFPVRPGTRAVQGGPTSRRSARSGDSILIQIIPVSDLLICDLGVVSTPYWVLTPEYYMGTEIFAGGGITFEIPNWIKSRDFRWRE